MFYSPKEKKEKQQNHSAPHDDFFRLSLKFYSIYLFPLTPTDACRNGNGGDFGFLWISIDHIEMMLISTYRLMMFSHLKTLSISIYIITNVVCVCIDE